MKNVWQEAVDQMLVVANIGVAKDDVTLEEAVAMLNKLIDVHVNIERFYNKTEKQNQKKNFDDAVTYFAAYKHALIESLKNNLSLVDAIVIADQFAEDNFFKMQKDLDEQPET